VLDRAARLAYLKSSGITGKTRPMSFKTIRDIDVTDKTVLLRADLNVPAKDGKVTDTTRIDRLKDTVDYLVSHKAKVVVLSHFGRPKDGPEPEFSLKFLIPDLEKSWGCKVMFAKNCIGKDAQDLAYSMKPGDVAMLENLRFHKGEEKNDPAFVAELAKLGDIYVNDAFSAAHRAHASTEGLAHVLPTAAGLLMEAELNALSAALEDPEKPVMAIVGGAKISTKLSVLDNLVRKVQVLFLGGGMANTFMFAQGIEIGKSLCEKDMADEARKIIATAKASGCEIMLPIDRVIVDTFGENAPNETVPADKMPADREAVDIGPATIRALAGKLQGCKTVLWNGPLGVFEVKPFDTGTNEAAKAVAELTKAGKLVSVAGGGDTVSALEHAGVADRFTYVSSAGGAFLEWMEGKELPGVAALNTSSRKAA
jgi:phosphoglycerate kinase